MLHKGGGGLLHVGALAVDDDRVDLLLELLEEGLDERLSSKIKQAVSKYYERCRPCYLLLTD